MVSIILVNFNGAKDTIECIDSIEKTSEKNYQVIVVDNQSTDNSVELLEKAKEKHDFILLKSPVNNGFSAGNNLGIKYALKHNADYILLLNNDTIVAPGFLSELLKPLSENENCGATIGKIYYEQERNRIWYAGGSLDATTARTEHWHYDQIDSLETNKEQSVSFATGCCLCIPVRTLNKVGLLDESYFLYEEDADYSLRITRAGYEIVYNPKSIIYHKVSASTGRTSPVTQYYSIRNKYRLIKQFYKGYKKLIAYSYNTLLFTIRCLKGKLKFKYFFLGLGAFCSGEKGKRVKPLK